ncbi:ferredoxin [Actinoalloteichus hymeniacidonis]|uniref:Ferredoxin n=1 Tax=Actinoalloteichus hymeniacidonis TaxID=340345 RepID=A0AAC9MXL5_9PSEU|nr:ferredoxin [Actinoalloteichus hymeniacidonis]AOS62459.1 ferredoxin [Actinoalloteichus hymeniacidonis]MBB5909510.1 ferredoxin [Actinoalloteichus hymeniacidonis]
MSRWKIDVNQGACVGSGMCAGTAPEHFRLDGAAASAISEEIDAHDGVIDAADSCPVEAILVRELVGGKVVAPVD